MDEGIEVKSEVYSGDEQTDEGRKVDVFIELEDICNTDSVSIIQMAIGQAGFGTWEQIILGSKSF